MLLNWLSRWLAAYLSKQVTRHSVRTSTWEALLKSLQPGDVLLVEGNTRISAAIKFLTQSTWSHAALYLGPETGLGTAGNGEPHVLVEADLFEASPYFRIIKPTLEDNFDYRAIDWGNR